jgi:hypothetical protein
MTASDKLICSADKTMRYVDSQGGQCGIQYKPTLLSGPANAKSKSDRMQAKNAERIRDSKNRINAWMSYVSDACSTKASQKAIWRTEACFGGAAEARNKKPQVRGDSKRGDDIDLVGTGAWTKLVL